MPARRKACDRCRIHKARCVRSDDSTACMRCWRLHHACFAPPNETLAFGDNSTLGVANPHPQPLEACLIDEVEEHFQTGVLNLLDIPISGLETLHSGSVAALVDDVPIEPSDQKLTGSNTGYSDLEERIALPLDTSPTFGFPMFPPLRSADESCDKFQDHFPAADEGHILLLEYLHDFNSKIPLFAPDSLYALFRDCYSGAADETPLTWVLVYATMGISFRLRAMSLFATPDDSSRANWYIGKCIEKLPHLLMQSPSLRLVQALLSIGILLNSSSRSPQAPLFVSIALRMAQDLGYNELTPEQSSRTIAGMEMSYVFWIAFFTDAHISLANQRPSAQRLADIITPMPVESVLNWWEPSEEGRETGQWHLNIFALHSSLAIIEAEAAEQLFSASTRRRSLATNATIYGDILSKLEIWRESSALSKLDATDLLKVAYRSDIVHSIVLEAAYFRTVYQLYATSTLVGFGTKVDVFKPAALQKMMEKGIAPCRHDAQRFLKLVISMPQGNVSTTWASIQALVAALCTILSLYVVGSYELEVQKTADLQVCKDVLNALAIAAESGISPAHYSAIELCRETYLRAQVS